jgi:hypothetical protein
VCFSGTAGERDQDAGEGHRGAEEGDQGEGQHCTQQRKRKEGLVLIFLYIQVKR